ncbi:MAG: hypothetical protein IPM91_03590 [Bacteroidetes bacterium]|nr:hypothetical protein [Bacteroidota bacterium]
MRAKDRLKSFVKQNVWCFYRYNSSKELSILANFFITNLAASTDFPNALQNFKIDYILHAVNMKDCIFKDTFNTHSIDGLLEVMTESGIGNGDRIRQLITDTAFQAKYSEMRHIRNKLAGHMDKTIPLADLLKLVDDFDIVTHDFVNKLDKTIYDTRRNPHCNTTPLSYIQFANRR